MAAKPPAPHLVVLKDNERLTDQALPTESQTQDTVRLRGWRGERVSAQVVAWAQVGMAKWPGCPRGIDCSALQAENGGAVLQPRCRYVAETMAHGKPVADVVYAGRWPMSVSPAETGHWPLWCSWIYRQMPPPVCTVAW